MGVSVKQRGGQIKYYTFPAAQFGLGPAGLFFNRLLFPIVRHIRPLGYKIAFYGGGLNGAADGRGGGGAAQRPQAQNVAGCRRGVEPERVVGSTGSVGAHRLRRRYSHVDFTGEAPAAGQNVEVASGVGYSRHRNAPGNAKGRSEGYARIFSTGERCFTIRSWAVFPWRPRPFGQANAFRRA